MMKPQSLLVALAVVTTGVIGCAGFHARPLSAEVEIAAFNSRTLADPGLQQFLRANGVGPAAAWDLHSLTLVALYSHPDLDLARAELATADAAGITAGERPNPTVGLSPSYDTTTSPPWILGLSFDIPIETAGKRGYRLATAAALSDAARLRLGSAAWQVRSRLRRKLLALFAASEGEALLREREIALEAVAHFLELQLRAGEASPVEAGQARIALQQGQFALREAEKQTVVARIQVADALGVSPSALDGVDIRFEEFRALPRELPGAEAQRNALVNRADIRAALADYAATQSALQLEIAKQYPNIHLNPGYQLDQADNKWCLGLTIELPLLNQNQGAIAEAEARRRASSARFAALQDGAISEVAQAVAACRASRKNVEASEVMGRDLDVQLRTTQGMVRAGELSQADLALKQLEIATARLLLLDTDIKAQEASGALEDALQSPVTLPIDSIAGNPGSKSGKDPAYP